MFVSLRRREGGEERRERERGKGEVGKK